MNDIINWCNQNAGFVSVLLFTGTFLLGLITGFFKSIIRKPKFKFSLIPGPTLITTYNTGEEYEGNEVHQTALSLYIKIINKGNAPASIKNISVGYHWNITKFNLFWIRYRLFWSWIRQQVVIREDFMCNIGEEKIKVYPFLFQEPTYLNSKNNDLYLKEGQIVSGIVYFEEEPSCGGAFPYPKKEQTKIKVIIEDSYGRKYTKKFFVPIVSLEEAQKYNSSFGTTLLTLKKNQDNKID